MSDSEKKFTAYFSIKINVDDVPAIIKQLLKSEETKKLAGIMEDAYHEMLDSQYELVKMFNGMDVRRIAVPKQAEPLETGDYFSMVEKLMELQQDEMNPFITYKIERIS